MDRGTKHRGRWIFLFVLIIALLGLVRLFAYPIIHTSREYSEALSGGAREPLKTVVELLYEDDALYPEEDGLQCYQIRYVPEYGKDAVAVSVERLGKHREMPVKDGEKILALLDEAAQIHPLFQGIRLIYVRPENVSFAYSDTRLERLIYQRDNRLPAFDNYWRVYRLEKHWYYVEGSPR